VKPSSGPSAWACATPTCDQTSAHGLFQVEVANLVILGYGQGHSGARPNGLLDVWTIGFVEFLADQIENTVVADFKEMGRYGLAYSVTAAAAAVNGNLHASPTR
jgi:hypothetical protein